MDRLTELETWMRSGAIDQRKKAIDELATYPSEIAVPLLQKVSTDPGFICRRFAVMGLGNHRTEASFQVLKTLLAQERDENVLAEVANSLFDFGDPAIPLLQQLFEKNRHWLTRQTILSVLMESDQDEILLAVIREGLQDETQTVKETAILALGKVLKGSLQSEAMEILIELAQAEFWRDRWRAATALTLATDPRAKPILAKLQQDENHYVAAAALESNLS
jgi:HEAT repeat protein